MDPPPPSTIERWGWDYIHATTLAEKLSPPEPSSSWEDAPPVRRLLAPGRPAELRVVAKAEKLRGLTTARGRAQALHTFFHHELQAAELMAWALLAFPDAPRAFRSGLARIAMDEARHMRMYQGEIARLGFRIGDFAVRDWFWLRVPSCETPSAFVAVMGLGFESANLEHAVSFADRFRAVGDPEGARVQELVALEEIAHVRFGARWFAELNGGLEFETWQRALPYPLTPLLMRGEPLAREARTRAGQPAPFLDALAAWKDEASR